MKIRCDEAMRRSKERAKEIAEFGIPKWRCRGDCSNCICGIVTRRDGTEHHNNLMSERSERIVKLYNPVSPDNEKEQPADNNE